MDKEIETINSRCYKHLIDITEQMNDLQDVMCSYIQMINDSAARMLEISGENDHIETQESVAMPVMMVRVFPNGTTAEFSELTFDDDEGIDELKVNGIANSYLMMEYRSDQCVKTSKGILMAGRVSVFKMNEEGAYLPINDDDSRVIRIYAAERATKVFYREKSVWMLDIG